MESLVPATAELITRQTCQVERGDEEIANPKVGAIMKLDYEADQILFWLLCCRVLR